MAHARSTRLSCILVLIFSTNFLAASERCESDDLYVIRSVGANGLVLDATDPEQVKVQHFTGSETQLWKFQPSDRPGLYHIINEHHNKTLDFHLGDDGHAHLGVSELQKCLQQKWNFNGKGHIVNAANGKNVDIDKANFTPGNRVIVWKSNGCNCQQFLLQKKI